MNTSEVSKLLGVSHSTINRWITQLKLDIDKTTIGHYRFSEDDIALLKQIQEQLHNGKTLQNIKIDEKKVRKATLTHNKEVTNHPKSSENKVRKATVSNKQALTDEDKLAESLQERITQIEKRLSTKADDVVSYQLLQHRSEIEELQKTVNTLTKQIEELESKLNGPQSDYYRAFNETATTEKQKKKPFFKTLFGLSN